MLNEGFLFHFSKVPAFLNVVDIAGLVKGAHEGKGLGNAFLSNINACDAVFHVVSKYSCFFGPWAASELVILIRKWEACLDKKKH